MFKPFRVRNIFLCVCVCVVYMSNFELNEEHSHHVRLYLFNKKKSADNHENPMSRKTQNTQNHGFTEDKHQHQP